MEEAVWEETADVLSKELGEGTYAEKSTAKIESIYNRFPRNTSRASSWQQNTACLL